MQFEEGEFGTKQVKVKGRKCTCPLIMKDFSFVHEKGLQSDGPVRPFGRRT